MLRPYQGRAHNTIMGWARRSFEPCLLESATGSGKSYIIAAVAQEIHRISGGKNVLCLARDKRLVKQNRAKYLKTGNPASVFSASGGGRCLRHPVVFGTPGTVYNSISRFGGQFAAVIVDEAHETTPTIRAIIEHIKSQNPYVRVIGLTATPYKLGHGYIYAYDPDGNPVSERQTRNPYYKQLVERITAQELIAEGYLTPPRVGATTNEHYNTQWMEVQRNGRFAAKDEERAYEGQGRKTSKIIADVVDNARGRMGVVIFAATRQHAHEVMESLPPGLSGMVASGERNNDKTIAAFERQEIKYIVNVGMLTTGWDCEHVDVVVLLRRTESVNLMQQMIGRGMRLYPGKHDCLVLDYAQNIETHCPDGDLFNPIITAYQPGGGEGEIKAECPLCHTINTFGARRNDDGFKADPNGYFVDLDGNRIMSDWGEMPAHYGRRCFGYVMAGGEMHRCGYRWTYRECPECTEQNDIAARYCEHCKNELVDPNEKLRLEFERAKADPHLPSTDKVTSWLVRDGISRTGNPMITVTVATTYRPKGFSVYYPYTSNSRTARHDYALFKSATDNGQTQPTTVTYVKDGDFWRLLAFNRPADEDQYNEAS